MGVSADHRAAEMPRSVGPNRFALIIGAMKSGTTSLFEILAQHPQIAPAKRKEPEFFSDLAKWSRGWDWYRGLWDWDPGQHQWALEASTAYTTMPNRPGVPERIAQAQESEFRFIYIIRNPLEQIRSHARHALYAGWGESLERQIPDYMIDFTRYAMQIDEYLKKFDRQSFLLLTLDEFQNDPETVLRRICSFLRIDEDFEFRNTGRRYNKGDLFNVSAPIASVTKSKPAELVRAVLPRAVRHRLRAWIGAFSRAEADTAFDLGDDEKSRIIDALRGDLKRLQTQYGVDVDRLWGIRTDLQCRTEP